VVFSKSKALVLAWRFLMRAPPQLIHTLIILCILGVPQVLRAAQSATQPIDIPAQDLGTALLQFARITHQQIAFDNKLVAGYSSSALSGSYTMEDGLRILLGAAPFVVRATPSGVLTIAAEPPPAPRVSNAAVVGQQA